MRVVSPKRAQNSRLHIEVKATPIGMNNDQHSAPRRKWNWGHGLTLGLICFVAFLAYMAYLAMSLPTNLVREDYYLAELEYGNQIDAESRGQVYANPTLSFGNGVLTAHYSSADRPEISMADLSLYYPADLDHDQEWPAVEATAWPEGGLAFQVPLPQPPSGLAYIDLRWSSPDGPAVQRVAHHFPVRP
jgi:hypothetical protein